MASTMRFSPTGESVEFCAALSFSTSRATVRPRLAAGGQTYQPFGTVPADRAHNTCQQWLGMPKTLVLAGVLISKYYD